jgi:hypothetical protein
MAVLHASSILLVVDLGGMLYKHLIIAIVTSRSIALEHTPEYPVPWFYALVPWFQVPVPWF